MRVLRDMLLALLNATLVLAIILTVALCVLLRQVAEIRDKAADMLAPQAARLERIEASVESIETQMGSVDPAEMCIEVAALSKQMPDLSGLTLRGLIDEIVAAVGQKLLAGSGP